MAFAGCLRTGVYERLVKRAGLANVSEDRIPSDARVVGELAFEDVSETRRIPLYEWERTVTGGWTREPESGIRLALNAGVESSLWIVRGRDTLVATLQKILEANYNIVTQEDWDAQRIDPARTSVAPLGNRGLQLVLEIDKTEFTTDKPIHVQLKVANLGPATLLVDNIKPLHRNTGMPPGIWVRDEAGREASSWSGAGIVEELMNESKTFVDPGKVIVLLDADLRQLRAQVLSVPDADSRRPGERVDSLDTWLGEGLYQIGGGVFGALHGAGRTAEIEFEITTGTPDVGE
ncbi:MAG: hypothetical protein JW993_16230 [Sedimentisphaerales bacterium]|nr:hypothetical protein [Sedimentisphaerales bacterium]